MHWLGVLSEGREKRVEPYFALNFGTGTLDEALAWVEYCNGTRNTYYANLRRKNGREEPYNIKYWALGNEVSPNPSPLCLTKADDSRCGDHGKSVK
jgi:alpha-N-arabinofuranosidase